MTATVCVIHVSVCHSDNEVLQIKQAAKDFDTFSKRDRSQKYTQRLGAGYKKTAEHSDAESTRMNEEVITEPTSRPCHQANTQIRHR